VTRRPLIISPRAERDIEAADRWWRRHRDAVDLLLLELNKAIALIEEQPEIGHAVRTRLSGTRRLPLPRTGYVLYYRVHPTFPTVELLAVWHGSRRRRPRL
jgi:plasmid stabilization system protein ParE